MHIVIPCKTLLAGKSRLAPHLAAARRRALCEEFLQQTLELAASVVSPEFIRVVSGDPDVLAIAKRHGTAGIREPEGGLNCALDTARDALLNDDARVDALLVLPIDLPFATADALAGARACAGDVVVGPDDGGTGTNLLLLRANAIRRMPFCFGPGSYAAHLTAAQARGLTVATYEDRRIAFDIDGASQYTAWQAWHASEGAGAARGRRAH